MMMCGGRRTTVASDKHHQRKDIVSAKIVGRRQKANTTRAKRKNETHQKVLASAKSQVAVCTHDLLQLTGSRIGAKGTRQTAIEAPKPCGTF
jgi:hypothetical protein